jgi:hypothetical protein
MREPKRWPFTVSDTNTSATSEIADAFGDADRKADHVVRLDLDLADVNANRRPPDSTYSRCSSATFGAPGTSILSTVGVLLIRRCAVTVTFWYRRLRVILAVAHLFRLPSPPQESRLPRPSSAALGHRSRCDGVGERRVAPVRSRGARCGRFLDHRVRRSLFVFRRPIARAASILIACTAAVGVTGAPPTVALSANRPPVEIHRLAGVWVHTRPVAGRRDVTVASGGIETCARSRDRYGQALVALAQPIDACAHVFDDTEPIWFVDLFDISAGLICARCDVLRRGRALHPRDERERAFARLVCARCDHSVDVNDACWFEPIRLQLSLRRLNDSHQVEHVVEFFGLQCPGCATRP